MSINKYNKAMQFLLRPKYLRDDVIIQEDSNEPLVARAGFEEGTKLTDYVEANIQTQSPYAGNLDLNTEAGYDTLSTTDDILDFTERNPFGEIDE